MNCKNILIFFKGISPLVAGILSIANLLFLLKGYTGCTLFYLSAFLVLIICLVIIPAYSDEEYWVVVSGRQQKIKEKKFLLDKWGRRIAISIMLATIAAANVIYFSFCRECECETWSKAFFIIRPQFYEPDTSRPFTFALTNELRPQLDFVRDTLINIDQTITPNSQNTEIQINNILKPYNCNKGFIIYGHYNNNHNYDINIRCIGFIKDSITLLLKSGEIIISNPTMIKLEEPRDQAKSVANAIIVFKNYYLGDTVKVFKQLKDMATDSSNNKRLQMYSDFFLAHYCFKKSDTTQGVIYYERAKIISDSLNDQSLKFSPRQIAINKVASDDRAYYCYVRLENDTAASVSQRHFFSEDSLPFYKDLPLSFFYNSQNKYTQGYNRVAEIIIQSQTDSIIMEKHWQLH